MKHIYHHTIIVVILAVTVIVGVFMISPSSADVRKNVPYNIVSVATDFDHPWAVAFLPRGEFLVSERGGALWRVYEDGRKTQIKNLPAVYHRGQGGLLDVVTAPDFKDNGYIYFSYAARDPQNAGLAGTEVARARLNLSLNQLSDVQTIFKATPKVKGGNHFGSRILFLADGTLLVSLGDRYDHKEEAQNPHNHLGTIIRIHPDGSIPDDNPFADGKRGHPAVYSYGHRNVQGMAMQPQKGDIWAHEHGPQGGDEINILVSGANYGWPVATYGISYWGFKISDQTSIAGMQDPLLHWTPSIAPSGMAFYTGDKLPQWRGDLFVGALAGQHLRRVMIEDGAIIGQEELLTEMGERIRDVRNGPDGYLYIVTDSPNGALLRLTATE